jgi:hypothetical protein
MMLNNNNIPKYVELVKQFGNKIGQLENKKEIIAKVYIPKMFNMLIREYKCDSHDARDRVIPDAGAIAKWGYWTILKFLPKESKDLVRRLGGLVSAAKRKEKLKKATTITTTTTTAKQTGANYVVLPHEFSILDENLNKIRIMIE